MMAIYPRLVRFLLFPPASLLLLGLWELWLRPVLLALPFCLFFFFFLLFFCCFPVFSFLTTFLTTVNLLVFAFFWLFRARFSSGLFAQACGSPALPSALPKHPCMHCDAHVTTASLNVRYLPPRMLATIMPYSPINHYFCLVLCLLRANASPCTLPNPSPPSWVTHYPFMSVRTCMCVFREISRPYMHGNHRPTNPFLLMLVLFLCHPMPLHPNAPIQTHLHPYTPVHTYLHPVLHCFYVYLGTPMF